MREMMDRVRRVGRVLAIATGFLYRRGLELFVVLSLFSKIQTTGSMSSFLVSSLDALISLGFAYILYDLCKALICWLVRDIDVLR